MAGTGAGVGLGAAIEALRHELSGAMLSGHGVGLQFELEPIELTLQTVVADEGGGKIGWRILELGGARKSEATQTLVLRLKPLFKRDDGKTVSDFTIDDVLEGGERLPPERG